VQLQFVLDPGRGVGPINFGMSCEEVAAAMAPIGGGVARSKNTETDCYFNNAFQVSFGNAGRVDFIEVASSLNAEVLFVGRDVTNTPADELLTLISQYDEFAPELSHPPDSYIFPNLIVSLWGRDSQYDSKGGQQRPVFGAVGVGGPTYLAVLQASYDRK